MWIHRRSRDRQLEAALREERAAPRDELVQSIAGRIGAKRPSAHVGSRLAFAGAISTFIVGAFASFGGFGYAASGAASTYHVVKSAVTTQKVHVTVHRSAAAAQYPKPPHAAAPATTAHAAGAQAQAAAGQAQTLPFTGISLALTVAIGLGLIILGLILRRRESRN